MSSSIHLILNEDSYLADQAVAKLRQKLKKDKSEFEEIIFDASSNSLDALTAELNSFSFFSTYKLVRVLNSEKIKKNDWEKVIDSQKQNDAALLLVVCSQKTLFKDLIKLAGNAASSEECLALKAKDIPSLLMSAAKKQNKTLSHNNARLMMDLIGQDLSFLLAQLDLICLYAKQKSEIESVDIHALLSESSEQNVFSFTKSFSQNNLEQAFVLLKKILNQGEAPLKLMGLVNRHFRIILKTKLLLRKGMSAQQICQQIKIPPFAFEEYASQAKQLSWKKLIFLYEQLADTDIKLKGSPLPAEKVLESFLLDVF